MLLFLTTTLPRFFGSHPWLLPLLGFWNLYTFLLYAVDKRRAIRETRRISERTLLSAAALFGGAGALLAMKLVHHKTRKRRFALGVPLMLLVQLALLCGAARHGL